MNIVTFTAYFENATRLHLPEDMMSIIFDVYQDKRVISHWSRARFCQAYLRNEDGLAEQIQTQANVSRRVERIRAASTIADLKRQLAEAHARATGAA